MKSKMPEHIAVPLSKNRSLRASFLRAKKRSKKWIVFLSESGAEHREASRGHLKQLIGNKDASRFHFLVVNKPGLYPGRVSRREFQESFLRTRRIQDALLTLRQVVPEGHEIFLIGYSEGAYLAPQVATRDPRVKAVMMIGGGTRGWLKEELATATSREKKKYEKVIRDIYKNKNSDQRWNGFSYATWFSYRGDHALRAIQKLQIPMISILGARDKVIDLRSTIVDLMLTSENKNIQLHVFGDCGHYFSKHWDSVSRVLERFLSDLL